MRTEPDYKKALLILIGISTLIRAFLAAWLELGNDEVYYWTYALYPDWSHYDHPPMVGWIIQVLSLNLKFNSEFFIRLSSVVFMGINTYIIYLSGKLVSDTKTGFVAALLYNASVYAFVLTGVFILPDTPQNLFWMLSVYLMLRFVSASAGESRKRNLIILLGVTIGLSMLSKYTGVFLWIGFGLYVLSFDRSWLKKPVLYFSVLISAVFILPVVIWNYQNEFVSFSYHGSRVSIFEAGLRPDFFFRELFGQIFYNNPINVALIIMAIVAAFKGRSSNYLTTQRLILLMSLPLIMLFLVFALFRATLPHWTGPAYNSLLILAAAHITSGKYFRANTIIGVPKVVKAAILLLALFLLLGSLQIKFGFIPMQDNNPYHRLGRHDITLDMYGFRPLLPAFQEIRKIKISKGEMSESDAMVNENWFEASKYDYYLARPLQLRLLGLGRFDRINKYNWINDARGGFSLGENYWYLTDSRNYKHPEEVYTGLFSEIIASDTITIMRMNKPAKRVFVFMLKDLKEDPETFFNRAF